MLSIYDRYIEDKASGNLVRWEDLSRDQLFDLFCNSMIDSMVADLFGISISKVRYARKKHGITNRLISIYQLLNGEDRQQSWDETAKSKLLSDDNADSLAIGLTHLFFRNGPVEDMHARGQLSENDMMILNKYMVNTIATVLFLAKNSHWFELECLLKFDMLCGAQWDKPVVDLLDVYKLVELMTK